MMGALLDPSWHTAMISEFEKPYFKKLSAFIQHEYEHHVCFPECKDIFRATHLTPFAEVRVVILGQDPYHTPGAAMGLSFSIPNGTKVQPSLKNIFKELETDLGIRRTNSDLSDLGAQGVLLLNSVLTVQNGMPASHKGQGWEAFTNAMISTISRERKNVVFVLWGNYAISKKLLIDETRHLVITAPHPSPFSAYTGFFGSRPFSQIQAYLIKSGQATINWG